MGICLSNQDHQLLLNSQNWHTIEDFFKKFGKMNKIQAKQWCQKNMNNNIKWINYIIYPYGSNEFAYHTRQQMNNVINIIDFKRENKQKWRRIKYISIENEDNFQVITMIAYQQFYYDHNLIFHDSDSKAQLYYKCIFYFDLTSGLISKIVFISLDQAKGKRKINDQDIQVDISQARPIQQKQIQEEKRQKIIQENKIKEKEEEKEKANLIHKPRQITRNYIAQSRQKDKKIDNQRRERQTNHRRAQQNRNQQRRQWQYQRQRQAYRKRY